MDEILNDMQENVTEHVVQPVSQLKNDILHTFHVYDDDSNISGLCDLSLVIPEVVIVDNKNYPYYFDNQIGDTCEESEGECQC